MKIPDKFKKVIAKTFYDKNIQFFTLTKGIDSEGGRLKPTLEISTTRACNVHLKTNRNTLEEHGIESDSDVVLTTDEEVQKELVFVYLGTHYRVKEVIKRDSHFLVGGVKVDDGTFNRL